MNSGLKRKINKQTFLGITLIGAIVVGIFYMLVYQELERKTQELTNSNTTLKNEVRVLEEYDRNSETYQRIINECIAEIKELVSNYPEDVVEEDIVMLAENLEDKNAIRYTTITMETKEPIYIVSKDLIAACNIGDGSVDQVYERTEAVYASITDYEGLKGCISQIQDSKYRIGIDRISYVKNEETGELEGQLNLSFYNITGTGLGGMDTKLKGFKRGMDDIFKLEKVIADDSEEEAMEEEEPETEQ